MSSMDISRDMHIDVSGDGAAQHVVLRGRLDAATVGDVRVLLQGVLAHGTGDLVLDLTDVDVADATGLGVLVGAHRRAERLERHLVLTGVGPRLDRLLRMTRLHRILRVQAVAEAAAV